jgi:hypothetical protein
LDASCLFAKIYGILFRQNIANKRLTAKIFFLKEFGPAISAGPFLSVCAVSILTNWGELIRQLPEEIVLRVKLCFCVTY